MDTRAPNSEGLELRQASLADLPEVRRCAYAAFSKYIERIGKAPAPMGADFVAQIGQGLLHVAVEGARFLGYVAFFPEGDHVHLDSIAVLPEHSGKGIGKRLLGYVERQARRHGLQAVELYTNEAMVENVAMYKRLGYTEIERKHHQGFNRVFFRKSL